MTAKAVVTETPPPLKHTTALVERLRQLSAAAGTGACAGVGARAERLKPPGVQQRENSLTVATQRYSNLECTHIMHSKLVLSTGASSGLVLAAGCM
jgi:hypothetical protein